MASDGVVDADIASSAEQSATDSATQASQSLLSRLRAPTAADITRKRKIRANPPHTTVRKKKPACQTDPKSVSAAERAREYSSEMITVSSGKLFCSACREELSLKLSIIKNHVQSGKHAQRKKQLNSAKSREQEIAVALKAYEKEAHPSGETLPEDHKPYRVKVVSTFLKAGVLLAKIEQFRELLEQNAYRLTDRRGMSDIIPFLHAEEKRKIKAEIAGKNVSVIFDGTTRLGEALVIVLRTVTSFRINQYLVCFQTLSKSMTGEELARELIRVLSTEYGLAPERLLAAMRDRASVNGVAMATLRVVYPSLIDVGCYAHTIDIVGEKFQTPNLHTFIHLWISLFSHSPRVRLWWKNRIGKAMASYCSTRWWSKWEVIHQVMKYFGDIAPFLEDNPELSPVTRGKLLELLQNATVKAHLQIEIAAIVDAGEAFVKATYNLEGDGPLAFRCYEILSTLTASIQVAHYPNVQAIAQTLSCGSHVVLQQWINYGKACVMPGLQYFLDKFTHELSGSVGAFKAAQLCFPQKVVELRPTAATVDSLQAFPFVKVSVLASLKAELPTYLAKAAGIDPDIDPLTWWRTHSSELPHWSAVAADILLVQPSSAAAERVFSLLKSSFGPQQDSSLNDYIETALMLQYNNH